ncbi:MAG: D-aminoacyl-tRNA deacylase [candidate division WS2 bacterium]|uniref:D-aminoacyl-tRNA deacylase n=1 Tax=Psychracetigena formicireducens TaxID=2986056 RepID=A0A9E2BGV0_PSYF1|nr:D-aminoacyl-tRNA deacylase [Candidatus Psychracetigena formicireducens]MBT9144652.1 D-aminoacyl-tRNA deacylase [Candidatus Psychracetigena formicireducens]
MRVVVQRVKSASVIVEGQVVSEIARGILVFVSIEEGDEEKDLSYIAQKVLNLRIFENDLGKFDKSVLEIDGEILVVSQFTISGDVRKGRRPDFTRALSPDKSIPLYEDFIRIIKNNYSSEKIQEGVFQAHMDVQLINDGPVTILISSKKEF